MIKDRVVQMAVKGVIEPIFEAYFEENSYGFRPKRDAHQAMDDLSLYLRMDSIGWGVIPATAGWRLRWMAIRF